MTQPKNQQSKSKDLSSGELIALSSTAGQMAVMRKALQRDNRPLGVIATECMPDAYQVVTAAKSYLRGDRKPPKQQQRREPLKLANPVKESVPPEEEPDGESGGGQAST